MKVPQNIKHPNRRGRSLLNCLACMFLAAGSALLVACAESAQPARDATPASTPQQVQPATSTAGQPASKGTPPATQSATLAEAQGVVTRIYRDAVVVETDRSAPFVVGDFNGDAAPDIAVVVRPAAGKLQKVNSEYANWIVEDPQQVVLPEVHGDVKVLPPRPKPVIVRQGDLLLAVIHGFQQDGWRNPLASQTYLLKNAVADELHTQTAAEVLNTATDKGRLPPLRGDVLRATLAGAPGFIYWTGAKYAWFHPAEHQ